MNNNQQIFPQIRISNESAPLRDRDEIDINTDNTDRHHRQTNRDDIETKNDRRIKRDGDVDKTQMRINLEDNSDKAHLRINHEDTTDKTHSRINLEDTTDTAHLRINVENGADKTLNRIKRETFTDNAQTWMNPEENMDKTQKLDDIMDKTETWLNHDDIADNNNNNQRQKRAVRQKRRGRPRLPGNSVFIQPPGSYSHEIRHCQQNHPPNYNHNTLNHVQQGSVVARNPKRVPPHNNLVAKQLSRNREQLYATEAEDLANDAFFYSHLDDDSHSGKIHEANAHFIQGNFNEKPTTQLNGGRLIKKPHNHAADGSYNPKPANQFIDSQHNTKSINQFHGDQFNENPTNQFFVDPLNDIPTNQFIESQFNDMPNNNQFGVHHPTVLINDKPIRYPKKIRPTIGPTTENQAYPIGTDATDCKHNNHNHNVVKKHKRRKLTKNVEIITAPEQQHPNHNYGRAEKIFVSKLLSGPEQLHEEIDNIFQNDFNGRDKRGSADKTQHWELRIMPRPAYGQ